MSGWAEYSFAQRKEHFVLISFAAWCVRWVGVGSGYLRYAEYFFQFVFALRVVDHQVFFLPRSHHTDKRLVVPWGHF